MRSYEDYKTMWREFEADTTVHEKYGELVSKMRKEIAIRKPTVLLDVGSGAASFIGETCKSYRLAMHDHFKRILGHRILKYDKRWKG